MRTLVALMALLPVAAHAEEHALVPLPSDRLVALAPLLKTADLALIESYPDGKLKQVSILSRVAASPKQVRDVVLDLEHYRDFVRNMSESSITRNADGSIDQKWVLDLTLTTFDGVNRYRFPADGAVDVEAIDPNDEASCRWEFYAAPGGGTVVVQYSYTDVQHSNSYIKSILKKMPTMEHGLGLSAGLLQVQSAKHRAELIAGHQPPFLDGKQKIPGFNFLLERGRVALMRSYPNGKLADISVLDRVAAPRERVEQVVLAPAAYRQFMDGVDRSEELTRSAQSLKYHLVSSMPLITWDTRFFMERDLSTGGIDVLGVDGDLKGAHYRWDLTATGPGGTLAVLRASQNLAASTLVLRALFQKEPIFEHGIAVALGLVQVAGVRARSEGKR